MAGRLVMVTGWGLAGGCEGSIGDIALLRSYPGEGWEEVGVKAVEGKGVEGLEDNIHGCGTKK